LTVKFESLHDALAQREKVLHALQEAREALNADDFPRAASLLGFARSTLEVAADASLFLTRSPDLGLNEEIERTWRTWKEYFAREPEAACEAYAKFGFFI
jgi:hypothetical protein